MEVMLQNHVTTSLFLDSCIEEDTDFLGNLLPGLPVYTNVANPTACRTLCQSNSNCKFWTYGLTAHSGKCWLKSSDSGRQSYSGLISGQKTCCKLSR